LAKGTRVGFDIAQDGDLLKRYTAWLGGGRDVAVAQRAVLPNLPGRWLYASSGPLAGRWLRESANQHIDGFASRTSYDAAQTIRLRSGTHVGYRFATDGSVTSRRSLTLSSRSSASSSVRAIINGTTYWRLSSGPLDGFWIVQSAAAYRRGKIGELRFTAPPLVDVSPGTYTAYRYDRLGRITVSLRARIGSTTSIRVSAWAVINGTPHYLVSSGAWVGLWLADTTATRLHV
jgi:hypothetical protein